MYRGRFTQPSDKNIALHPILSYFVHTFAVSAAFLLRRDITSRSVDQPWQEVTEAGPRSHAERILFSFHAVLGEQLFIPTSCPHNEEFSATLFCAAP